MRPGDTLSAIAERLGVPGSWPAIYAANRAAIGAEQTRFTRARH